MFADTLTESLEEHFGPDKRKAVDARGELKADGITGDGAPDANHDATDGEPAGRRGTKTRKV
jgi:hypothetical protein